MTESSWGSTRLPDSTTVGWALPLGLILVAVGLVQSADPPAAVTGWRIALGLILFGLLLLTVDTITDDHLREWLSVGPSHLAGMFLFMRYR